jgi:hypothetical protein
MTTSTRIGVALAIGALAATAAVAQTTYKKYGEAAGWQILINENTNGCFMAQGIGTDRQIQMGVSKTTDQRGYLALYTKKDANVSSGQKIDVLFDVDGQKFTGEATGVDMEGFDGAYVHFSNPDFIYGLINKKSMTITPKGRPPIVVNLAGTEDAFKALRACQDAR